MFELVPTKSFAKGLKKYRHDAKSVSMVKTLLSLLQKNEKLPEKYRLHKLKGQSAEFWECHVMPDLLLIYQKDEPRKLIILIDIGSHAHLGLA